MHRISPRTQVYWFRQAEMGMRLERIALGTKFDLRKIVPGGKL